LAESEQERDVVCLLRIQTGDNRALGELYDRYTPLLYPFVKRILKSGADAEDTLQDVWLQVWRRSATYDPRRGTVAAWLLTVARSRALDRYRSASSRRLAEQRSKELGEAPGPTADPAGEAVLGETGLRVRDALAQLHPKQRQALEIAYFEGLSQSEVAARLDTPLGTVKSWTRQGLQKLREILPLEEWA
jgi:RNA polymerase sigma-70 factor (ECF subfamily)